jgi:D-alanyl-D-alanine carboxypeptidase
MRDQHSQRVEELFQELGIPAELVEPRCLPPAQEPAQLALAETGSDGRQHLLTPAAAKSWQDLTAAARKDGVRLHIVSAFRSIERQADIIRRKLQAGVPLEQILAVLAPPGYSEHHTGLAVDVATPGCPPLETRFEDTDAFKWLSQRAYSSGFRLSFPRGNRYGYVYEPWHWRFGGGEQ